MIQNTGKSEKIKTVKCPYCSERIAELEVSFWGYVSIESGKAVPDAGLKIRCPVCGGELGSDALEDSGIVLPVLNQLAGFDQEEHKELSKEEALEPGKICSGIALAKEKEATE